MKTINPERLQIDMFEPFVRLLYTHPIAVALDDPANHQPCEWCEPPEWVAWPRWKRFPRGVDPETIVV